MPFDSKDLSRATVKGFVDRLHRFAKTTDASAWPPKRAWSQEAIAKALGFPSYHALQGALEDKPKLPVSHNGWLFESPSGRPFFRVSPEWYNHRVSQTGFLVPLDLWKEPLLIQGDERERRTMFNSLAEQSHAHGVPVLWVQGPWALQSESMKSQHSFKTLYSLTPAINRLMASLPAAELIDFFVEMNKDVLNTMWKGRAITLLSSVLLALVYLRDQNQAPLTVQSFQDALLLESVIELSKNPALPEEVRQGLWSYLRALPSFKAEGEQTEVVLDQHGYVTMFFTRILGGLERSNACLNWSDCESVALSETTDRLPLYPALVDNWAWKNPGGVLILEGLSGQSNILSWLPHYISQFVERGIRIVLGTRYLNDWALSAEAMQPLLSRFPNGFIMDGAADDPWVDHAAKAGWKTVQGRG